MQHVLTTNTDFHSIKTQLGPPFLWKPSLPGLQWLHSMPTRHPASRKHRCMPPQDNWVKLSWHGTPRVNLQYQIQVSTFKSLSTCVNLWNHASTKRTTKAHTSTNIILPRSSTLSQQPQQHSTLQPVGSTGCACCMHVRMCLHAPTNRCLQVWTADAKPHLPWGTASSFPHASLQRMSVNGEHGQTIAISFRIHSRNVSGCGTGS